MDFLVPLIVVFPTGVLILVAYILRGFDARRSALDEEIMDLEQRLAGMYDAVKNVRQVDVPTQRLNRIRELAHGETPVSKKETRRSEG